MINATVLSSQVYEELVQVIKDAEEGLFHLKRARLLREADSVLNGCNHKSEDVKVEPLDPADVEPEPLEEQSYVVGSKCRFRHSDGRWYNGQIVELDDSDSAKISFLTPISENMLVCTIFWSFVFLHGCFKIVFFSFCLFGGKILCDFVFIYVNVCCVPMSFSLNGTSSHCKCKVEDEVGGSGPISCVWN